jgi:hypothetical protein
VIPIFKRFSIHRKHDAKAELPAQSHQPGREVVELASRSVVANRKPPGEVERRLLDAWERGNAVEICAVCFAESLRLFDL